MIERERRLNKAFNLQWYSEGLTTDGLQRKEEEEDWLVVSPVAVLVSPGFGGKSCGISGWGRAVFNLSWDGFAI